MTTKSAFDGVPTEIITKILRDAIVTSDRDAVAILSTCRLFHDTARPILYSQPITISSVKAFHSLFLVDEDVWIRQLESAGPAEFAPGGDSSLLKAEAYSAELCEASVDERDTVLLRGWSERARYIAGTREKGPVRWTGGDVVARRRSDLEHVKALIFNQSFQLSMANSGLPSLTSALSPAADESISLQASIKSSTPLLPNLQEITLDMSRSAYLGSDIVTSWFTSFFGSFSPKIFSSTVPLWQLNLPLDFFINTEEVNAIVTTDVQDFFRVDVAEDGSTLTGTQHTHALKRISVVASDVYFVQSAARGGFHKGANVARGLDLLLRSFPALDKVELRYAPCEWLNRYGRTGYEQLQACVAQHNMKAVGGPSIQFVSRV